MNAEPLRESFAARFHRPCAVVSRAPGRVNLIGEHTDYNEGYVLPIATRQSTWVGAARHPTGPGELARLCAYSASLDDDQTWPVDGWRDAPRPRWTAYVAGIAALLAQRGVQLNDIDLLIHSDVPVGSGLSSSAALTVAVAKALCGLGDCAMSLPELAALCRAAEHEYAGVPCGVMDQYASLACREGAALLLDCRTLEYEEVPLPLGDHTFVVVHSGVRHELASSEYARRQQQCAAAVAYFQHLRPGVRALRDVDEPTVRRYAADLEPVAAARAVHVTSENQRTLDAVGALRRGDLIEMGRLMDESHRSLRDDYQVSCPELDLLVEVVRALPGVLGARMTGGGFGGCIVALAARESVEPIRKAVREQYDQPGRQATVFEVRPGPGASIEFP